MGKFNVTDADQNSQNVIPAEQSESAKPGIQITHTPPTQEELDMEELDLPEELITGGMTTLSIGGVSFKMTTREWNQVKTWIAERRQETAMRWWSEQFGISFSNAVKTINRVQIAVEFNIIS